MSALSASARASSGRRPAMSRRPSSPYSASAAAREATKTRCAAHGSPDGSTFTARFYSQNLLRWDVPRAALLVASAIPFGVFAALLWWNAARRRPGGDAVWIALFAAFGSFVVIYANSYFGHVLAGTFFLLSYVLAVDRDKHFYLAGFFSGCAVA